MSTRPLPVFRRYLLFQLPGTGIAIVVLAGLVELWDMPFATAAALLALWVVKDLVLYPFLKVAYDPGGRSVNGIDAMIGVLGIAQEDLDPEGYVKIGSERWRARAAGEEPIPNGTLVRILSVRDLTVVVELADSGETVESAAK